MNCRNCGTPIVQGEKFCRNCGASTEVNNQPLGGINPAMQPVQTNQQMGQVMQQPVQPMAQPNNQYAQPVTPMVQPTQNKNNKGIIVLVIVIVAAIVVIGAVILFTNKGKGNGNNNSNSDSNAVVSNSNSNTATPVTTQTSKVRYKGFEFSIPVDYLFEIQTSALLVTDDMTWAATIEVLDGSYTTIKNRKELLKTNVEKNGFLATSPVVRNYGGAEWVTIEMSKGSSKALLAYTQGTATKVMGIIAYTKNNTIDYTILEKLGPIIKDSTYVGATQSISANAFGTFSSSKGLGK